MQYFDGVYNERIQVDGWSGREGFPREMILEQTPTEGVKREGDQI